MTDNRKQIADTSKQKKLFHAPCSMLHEHGFTFIEAVVATSVFAFIVVSVLGVYLTTIRLDARTRSERAVSENARFIMEYLTKLVRNGTINYAAYPAGRTNTTTTELWVLNQADELEHIFLSGTDLRLEKGAVTNLNSSGVRVTSWQVLATPDRDPLTAAKLANQQPNVTVIMELTSDYGDAVGNSVVLNLQTTLASRDYPSREP